MAIFLKLKLAGSTMTCLVNIDHIQHVRPLTKGCRIYWGTAMETAMEGEEGGGSYVDRDDFGHSVEDIVERLRLAQVEVF